MTYWTGQFLGVCASLFCILLPQFERKTHMLVCTIVINLLFGLNMLLLDGFGSVVLINLVAVVQAAAALWRACRGTWVSNAENLLFLLLYLTCGFITLRSTIDLLPIVGALFNMLATFQRREQPTRWFLLFNAVTFCLYYALMGSTALAGVLCSTASILLSLFRHSKKADANVCL